MKDLQNTAPPWWFRLAWIIALLLFANLVFAADGGAKEITIVGESLFLQATILDIQEGPSGMVVFVGRREETDTPDEPDAPVFDCSTPDFGPLDPVREGYCHGTQ